MGRDLSKAAPGIKTLIEEVLKCAPDEFCKEGEEIRVTYVDRSVQEQMALYAQGRKSLAEVNQLRKYAGMSGITDADNQRKVTWTLASRHIADLHDDDPVNDLSRAVDLGIFWHGKYVTGNTSAETVRYLQLRQWVTEVARRLTAEGRISFTLGIVKKDLPHYQEDPPYSTLE